MNRSFNLVDSCGSLLVVAKKYCWLIPVAIAIVVYMPGLNNYFVYDDFMWLFKAKTVSANLLQAFQPEVYYFDPLVHATYFLLYSLAGLDPFGYQAFSILLHALNAALVYKLSRTISGDTRSGLYAGIIFAASATIADAVLWQSSVVDLLSTLFSLATMLAYRSYLESDAKRSLLLSYLFFVSALSSKGTPVVLPLILFYLGMTTANNRRFYVSLIPYALLTALYFILLSLVKSTTPAHLNLGSFNVKNVFMGFCSLFIPERLLADWNLGVASLAVIVLVFLATCLRPTTSQFITVRRTGVVIAACSILPFLVLNNFKFATADGTMVDILASPSHRIYLASVGTALLGGGVLRLVETLLCQRWRKISLLAPAIALVVFIGFNAYEVSQRDLLWEYAGEFSRATVTGMQAHRERIVEGSQLVLFNFNNAKGFLTALVKVFFDVNEVTILMNNNICFGAKEEPPILAKADKSALLVFDRSWQVHDLSDLFRLKLQKNIQASNATDKMPFIMESIKLTNRLNQAIGELTHEQCVEIR